MFKATSLINNYVNLYEKYFFEQIVNVKDKLKTRIQTGTDADSRKRANLVPDYKKPKPGDAPEIFKLKSQRSGKMNISNLTAKNIIARYNLKDFIPGKNEKQLSTSGIFIGYNPQMKSFYLKK